MVNQHILPGHKSLPEGEDRRRDPHAHRLAPENIKPTRPITADGAEGRGGRIFLALSRRPTAYCRATTTAALTGSTTATTFSAKSLLATTSTYCERQEAKAPPTKEASSPEQVNHSSARSRSNTEGDGRGARLSRGAIPLKKQLNKHQRKAAQAAASQNGKLILCITSRVPMGGPTVQPMLRMV